MNEGTRTVHPLRQAPALAAGCLARNIENHRANFGAGVRALDAASMEVAVRINSTARTVSVAHVVPTGTGSTATIWMTPDFLYRSDEFIPAMIQGC